MEESSKVVDFDLNERNQIEKTLCDLHVYICTWNVNTSYPYDKLNNLISFDKGRKPDICVYGFQEVNAKPFERLSNFIFHDSFTYELSNQLGKLDYIRIQSFRLVGNLINVFVKKSLLPLVKSVSIDWIRLGFNGLWGNKGSNICILDMFDHQLCFINTHLCAHLHHFEKRKAECSEILDYIKAIFKNMDSSNKKSQQRCLFYFGDLNFRVENQHIQNIFDLIKEANYEKILENDQNKNQLKMFLDQEKWFSHFKEADIKFPPTYKFSTKTNEFSSSRIPSYCDRILYCQNYAIDSNIESDGIEDKVQLQPLKYDCISELNNSDHKPVYGLFELKKANIVMPKWRVHFLRVHSNEQNNLEIVYQVADCFQTHKKDWIGLYEKNNLHVDDYVTYAWTEQTNVTENDELKKESNKIQENSIKRRTVIDQYYLSTGVYCLGYFSYLEKHLVELSPFFEIII